MVSSSLRAIVLEVGGKSWEAYLDDPRWQKESYGCTYGAYSLHTLVYLNKEIKKGVSFHVMLKPHFYELWPVDEEMWGFSGISIVTPTMNSKGKRVSIGNIWGDSSSDELECGKGLGNWRYHRVFSDDTAPKHFIGESNECIHGFWAAENEWVKLSFFTEVEHNEIKVKVRVWVVCYDDSFTFRVKFAGNEVFRKESMRCEGMKEAPTAPWINAECGRTSCFEDLELSVGHTGIGPKNLFSIQLFGILKGWPLASETYNYGWGFSGLSLTIVQKIDSILEDVVPCTPLAWTFSPQIYDENRGPKESFHIVDGSICLYGLWGIENDSLERRFTALHPYMQLEIRARFWLVCALKRVTFGYIEINGKMVWESQRKSWKNCRGLTLAPYSSEWMDNYGCLTETPKTACYSDVVITRPYSEEDAEVLSIRFLADSMGGRPIKGGKKGWGISHFSVRILKARALWRKEYAGFWDGTSLNPNLEWFSAADLIGQRPSETEINLVNPGGPRTFIWTGYYENKLNFPVKFRVISDGNALLLVNNQIVINKMGEAGESPLETVESETLLLKSGKEIPIALYYSNNEDPGNVKLEWIYDVTEVFKCVEWKSRLSTLFFHNPSKEKIH